MANNLDVKDAAGATKVIKTTDNSSVHTPHHLCEQSGTWTMSITGLPAAVLLADNLASPTTPLLGSCVLIWDGATWDRWTGTVTANAGTNLNTSLLALEAGGNLAAVKTAAEIIDDWDESDRAKVNPIVGQAGVAGGSGVVGATTQRMVLATDVALPAGTNAIGKLAANSGVDIGDVDVASIAAGTNLIGAIVSARQHGTVYIGTTAYTVKQAYVRSAINNAEVTLVAGVASKKIRVLWFCLATNATFAYEWRSNSNIIIGQINIGANSLHSPPIPNIGYWMETNAGEDLRLFTPGNTTVIAVVNYIEV